MSEQTVLLRFSTQALDRARGLVRGIKVTLEQGVHLTKEARRELQAQLRERRAEVTALSALAAPARRLRRALERGAGNVAAAQEADEGRSFGEARLAAAQGIKAAKVAAAFTGGLPTAGALVGLLPQAAVVVLAKQVLDLITGEIDKRIQARTRDVVDLVRAQNAERERTFTERLARDPLFAGAQARRAAEQLARDRAGQARAGLSPLGREAVLLGGE